MLNRKGMFLAALLSAATASWCSAKPPDLPAEQGVGCPDGTEKPGAGDLFDLKVVTAVPAQPDLSAQQDLCEGLARRMYETGERHRRRGDLEAARISFEEAHVWSPTSEPGRRAIDRLHELEQARGGAAEEQDEPPTRTAPTTDEPPLQDAPGSAKQSFRQMRQRSVPLGLVDRSY